MRNTEFKRQLVQMHFSRMELIAFLLAAVIATIGFTFVYDLWHTAYCSFAFLNGHFKDFYDYNIEVAQTGTIVYYPTIYALFAIWNLPLRLFGITSINGNDAFVLLWQKCFCIVFLFFTFCALYRLAAIVLKDDKKAANSVFILLTIPFFFLYEFSWALYDTVYCTFLLNGIVLLLQASSPAPHKKRNLIGGILCLAITLTVKKYTVFIIIPVLFYFFKKIHHLCFAALGTISLYALETILYSGSPYFTSEVLAPLDGGFMFVTFWNTMLGNISTFLVVFMICCMAAYRCEEPKNLMFFLFVSSAALPVLSQQTPNWAIMMLPFYAILIADLNEKDRRFFYLLNMVFSVAMICFILTTRHHAYGETTIAAGCFGRLLFQDSHPYDYVLNMDGEFQTLTSRLFGTFDQSVSPVSPNLKYYIAVIGATMCYAAWILFPRKKATSQSLSSEYIDKKERYFVYGCLAAATAVYYVPILVWTVQNQRLFS